MNARPSQDRTGGLGRGWVAAAIVAVAALVGCSGAEQSGESPSTADAHETLSTPAPSPDGSDPTATAEPAPSAELFAAACAGELSVEPVGPLESAEIVEASGLVAGASGDVWWTHNDSGGYAPQIFAVGADGTDLATVDLDGAVERDWEDIAILHGTEGEPSILYVGDTGDNAIRRDPDGGRGHVRIFRLPEPELDAPDPAGPGSAGSDPTGSGSAAPQQLVAPVQTITLEFPDGAHDVEALLVDPVSGDLVLVTKDWSFGGRSEVYTAPGDLADGATATLEHVGGIDLGVGSLVTAADVTRDGSLVALRTYTAVHLFERPEGQPLWAAFDTTRCDAPGADENQGEALGFTRDGGAYLTVSEGQHAVVHRTAPS